MDEPYLSESQQIALFHAVGRRIASLVTGTRGPKIAEQVPEIADIPLLGAFVSLKRQGQLRSCMGTMSDRIALGNAMEQAAIHASRDDPRFEPIMAAELFELELEIWVLWGMKRVAQRGTDRLNAIQIGQHGVQIARGGNRGLLLPGVALEYQMDARTFLEAVCRKAGLPNDAWLDDSSLLHTFEGRAIRGPFSATDINDRKTADEMIFAAKFNRPGPRGEGPSRMELEELREACLTCFNSMVEGVSPPNYFPGLFDATVSGVVLSLNVPDRPTLTCSKISVRPDLYFQQSLIELLRVLGRQVEHFSITLYELQEMTLDLTVYRDPTIHGNAGRYDLSSVDSAYRAVMLSDPKGWVVQYDPTKPAETILAQGVEFLQPEDPDRCEVISFFAASTTPNQTVASMSKPNRFEPNRPSATAGTFIPSDPKKLDQELTQLLSGASSSRHRYSAVMVPHAGWRYSGRLAAQTLAQVEIPSRSIIFAPKHRSSGVDWAIAPNLIWELPGMSMESDLECAEIMRQAVDFFEYDDQAHAMEHSIEVILPILARLAPSTRIVGVAQAHSSWGMIQRGAEQFARFLKAMEDEQVEQPLLIISSDMNHFATEDVGRKVDLMALNAIDEAIDQQKPEILLETVRENRITMCGVIPAVFVMETLRLLGRLKKAIRTGYTTSAEASGDTTRVVGYAGVLFE